MFRLPLKKRHGRLCGAVHPAIGQADTARSRENWTPVTCTAVVVNNAGEYVGHRGKHRRRLAVGIVLRWAQ